jgi:hypothetical protein
VSRVHRHALRLIVLSSSWACSSSSVEPVAPVLPAPVALSTDTHGLSATLDQYREDVANERIIIRIDNAGADAVQIDELSLSWPGLTPAAPELVDFNVIPRMKVGLAVPYGTARCSSPPLIVEPVPDVPIAAIASTDLGEIVLPVTDPLDVLRRLYQPDCERQAIEDTVEVSFGDTWTVASEGVQLDGTLVLTRTHSDRAVSVTGISGSVLLLLSADGLPATMAADAERLEVPVQLSNGRCDGHALGESKQTYLFQLGLELDGEAAALQLRPGPAAQRQFFEEIIAKCPSDADGE